MDLGIKMLIIADDLTGAIDTGVNAQLMRLNPSVYWSIPKASREPICVVDTETRNISDIAAQEKVQKTLDGINLSSIFDVVYKKIDSTLRGHIMLEVKEIAKAFQPELIIFAPAFPAMGRIIVEDSMLVNEVPIGETEFAKDPLAPAYTGKITEWLQNNLDMPVYYHPISEVKSDMVLLNGCHTIDTITDFHLRSLVKALPDVKKRRILLVGSAALATEFFTLYKPVEKPVISFAGSVSQKTMDQIYYARKHGTKIIKLPIVAMYEDKDIRPVVLEALELLQANNDVIITAAEKRQDYEHVLMYEIANNLESGTMSRFVKSMMGELAREILPQADISGLLATGGDTAISIFNHLGVSATRVEREVVKGFVVSTLIGGLVPNLKVITKAGAFGEEADLYLSMQRLKEKV